MTETLKLRDFIAMTVGQIDDDAKLEEIAEFAVRVRFRKGPPHGLRRPGRGTAP